MAPRCNTKARPIDYLCVLDFEATCQRKGKPWPQEIIEFPTLLVDATSGEIIDTFHYYIKPDVYPTLSTFCTDLTGIAQETVDRGISLVEAVEAHKSWLKDKHDIVPFFMQNIPGNKKTFVYLTCGDWDLKTCITNQYAYYDETIPWYFQRWINLKPAFCDFKGHPNSKIGMAGMLRSLNLELIGRHHSGIDDCNNLARICKHMIERGWRPTMEMVSQTK